MWFKVDDSFAFNVKAMRAGDAVALWTRAGAWCAQQLTGGHVPDDMIASLGRAEHASVLVAVGLWKRTRTGYEFHDWDVYNPSDSEAKARRDAQSMGGSIGNHRRWHVAKGEVKAECAYCQREQSKPSGNRSGKRRRTDRSTESPGNQSVPSRPVPVEEELPAQPPADAQEPGTDVVATGKTVAKLPTAGDLVAAWVDGYQLGQGKAPTPALVKRVSGKAKELSKGLGLEEMRAAWHACRNAGREGVWDVVSYRPRSATPDPTRNGNHALRIAEELRSQGL